MRPLLLVCGLLAALLTALSATALLVGAPPLRTETKAGEFDAGRAKARLAAILGDERPHPADSAGNDAVRARLIGQIRSLGLTPVVRDQFACNEIHKRRGVTCARVRNVIVALGPAGSNALLLNTHYDSTPVGPAAGDAGAGVATMLEVARLLKDERLGRPVLLLFNEGEELGLVGARAFLADPLSHRVDSLVNLEARGTTGPVAMFETSLPNGPPVRSFGKAVDRPSANSLATDFYRQLPNYTDVNSFAERGWTTLNFGFIGNETRYHSPGDDLAALDMATLQHMGDQALAVTRELAASPASGGGTVLFADIAGRVLLVVPQPLGFALLGLMALGLAWVSFRRRGMWVGLATVAAALILAAGIAWTALWAIGEFREGSYWRAYPHWTELAVHAFGLFGAVAATALIARRLTVEQLRAAFWLAFVLLGAAVLAVAPGGIIFFLLAPLAALAGMAAARWFAWAERAGAIVAAVLMWLMLGAVLSLLGELMVSGPFFILAPLAALVAMPWLVEAKPLLESAGRAASTGIALLLALAGSAVVLGAPAYSADRQQRFTIQHSTDTTDGRSYWLVLNDGAPLPKRFGGIDGWERGELPHLERKGWLAPAPALPGIRPPVIELLGESGSAGGRTVTFRLRPNGAESLVLIADEEAELVTAGSGEFVRPFAPDTEGKYSLTCFGRSCGGATMQFTTRKPGKLELTLVGSSRGLPSAAAPLVSGRPDFARPQYVPDSTMTVSRIRL